jgi:hypothetical protein
MLIETDLAGGPVRVDDLDRDSVLWFAEQAKAREAAAALAVLHATIRWCETNTVEDPKSAAGFGEVGGDLDCPEKIGGDGRPMVAAFSAEPLAAAMEISTTAALTLMADALELAHRLPRVMARVEALEVPVWRARSIAQATSSLSPDAAAYVDAEIAGRAHRVGAVVLARLVENARARYDTDAHEEAEEAARESWDVTLTHAGVRDGRWLGTSWMQITGDTATLADLNDLVGRIAHDLLAAHPDLPLARRRVLALQVIVDRARAHGDTPAPGRPYKAYVHLTATPEGHIAPLGRVEDLGPATSALVREWLTGSRVTVTPVLDPDRGDPIDAHDPPEWMRELVIARDQHCVFPDCRRPARRCDLDHISTWIDPAHGGPPGQTHPGNLAPLCRRHHRAKTTTDPTKQWRYRRMDHGHYTWTGPQDQRLVVVPGIGTYSPL